MYLRKHPRIRAGSYPPRGHTSGELSRNLGLTHPGYMMPLLRGWGRRGVVAGLLAVVVGNGRVDVAVGGQRVGTGLVEVRDVGRVRPDGSLKHVPLSTSLTAYALTAPASAEWANLDGTDCREEGSYSANIGPVPFCPSVLPVQIPMVPCWNYWVSWPQGIKLKLGLKQAFVRPDSSRGEDKK
jgi:hypothetical protein